VLWHYRLDKSIVKHHHTTPQPFIALFLNFWTLWCKGKLTEADTPTIRLGATPSWLVPTSAMPHFFTGRMPFLPPNQQCQSTGMLTQLWKFLENLANLLIAACRSTWAYVKINIVWKCFQHKYRCLSTAKHFTLNTLFLNSEKHHFLADQVILNHNLNHTMKRLFLTWFTYWPYVIVMAAWRSSSFYATNQAK